MRIEQMTIRNYRVFKNAELKDVPDFAVLIGANGSGKSTLFDVFAFLRDALKDNVRVALAKRGGFREVVSRGERGPIAFRLKFRASSGKLVTYELDVNLEDGQPIITKELLKYRRGQHGKPWHFLDFQRGEGTAVVNEDEYSDQDSEPKREMQRLDSPDILAIKGLGQFRRFRVVSELRKLIEDWHLSDFHVSAARPSQETGYAEHLTPQGDNLSLVARSMFEQHPEVFQGVLTAMKRRVPGVSSVDAKETEDGRLVLRFQDSSFRDPFIARYVSDGTIKMFAYLVLLHDPNAHPLLCIEEPENQLYPSLLPELVEEFRAYAHKGGQVVVSTHSPDLLNGCELEEVYFLSKRDGFSQISRAADDKRLLALVRSGDKPGWLWKQGLFQGVDP